MSENNGLAGLGGEVKIPVGGDFTPSGMIAQWKAQVYFSFYSKTDIAIADIEPPAGLVIRKMGDGFRYYLKDGEALDHVRDALGEQFKPSQVWSWTAIRSTVLNVPEENLAKFQEQITFDCSIKTLSANKDRHDLHMIALPAMVYSIAVALGYNPPTISFSDLIGNQVIYDDALMTRMIGITVDPSATKREKYRNAEYEKSQLWQQRAGLWRGLGEENAAAYYPKGKGTKYDSTSDKLSACLAYLTHDWSSPMWARVIQVPDPRVDATYGEDKRLSIPAMTEIFASQAAATAVAKKENEERAAREASKTGTPVVSSNGSGVPEAWASDPDAWHTWIMQIKEQFKGKPLPAVKAAVTKTVTEADAKGEPVGATVDEIMAALKA